MNTNTKDILNNYFVLYHCSLKGRIKEVYRKQRHIKVGLGIGNYTDKESCERDHSAAPGMKHVVFTRKKSKEKRHTRPTLLVQEKHSFSFTILLRSPLAKSI